MILEDDKTDHFEKLAKEKAGDKDHTKGLKEEDNILEVLLDPHEDVPLEDPGPHIASEDGEKGVAGVTH